jgi:hypothetical protein
MRLLLSAGLDRSLDISNQARPPFTRSCLALHVAELLVIAAVIFGYALISERLAMSPITAPMVFTTVGLLAGPDALGWFDLDLGAPPRIVGAGQIVGQCSMISRGELACTPC